MHTAEYVTPNRTAPAVLAIAIHFALFYLLASGLGVVTSVLPPKPMTMIDVHEDPIEKPPVIEQNVDLNDLHNPFAAVDPSKGPTLVIDQDFPRFDNNPPIVNVGGGGEVVEVSVIGPRVLRSADPTYPSFSRLSGEEGTVLVKAMITPYGVVGDVQIEKSSGYSRLDDAAVKAVRSWRFAPAKRGTQAIATWVTVPVKFVLNSRG